MTRRTKLELEINRPTEVELLFDEPITGESQYGSYSMFALGVNGMEYSFFAPSLEVSTELSKLKKGDKAIITKLATQKGSKVVTIYDVQVPNKIKANPKAKSEVVSVGEVIEEIVPQDSPHDKYYHIMKQSYSDALEINSDLNGFTSDVARLAITLFIQRAKTQ